MWKDEFKTWNGKDWKNCLLTMVLQLQGAENDKLGKIF